MTAKCIILLLDGTWNDADLGASDTNIVRLRAIIARSLDHDSRACRKSSPAILVMQSAQDRSAKNVSLGQMVTIRESGTERRVTAAEAFLLHLTKRGLEGDGAAARASLALIEEARDRQSPDEITRWVLVAVAPGSVTSALEPLRLARKLDPYRETARMALEPWLVEAALARLGRTLSPADQRLVVKATRTPHKVRWPEWWSEHP